jgi:hypothetical protein
LNDLDQARRDLSKKNPITGLILVAWCILAAWHVIAPIDIDCSGSRSWLDWSTLPLGLFFIIFVSGILTGIWNSMKGDPKLIGDLFNPRVYGDWLGVVYQMAPRMTTVAVLVFLAVLYDAFFRYHLTIHASSHETVVHDMLLRAFRTYAWGECDTSGPD